jgi:hypothetical protein
MKFLISAVLIFVPCLSNAFPLTDARNLALGGLALSSTSLESAVFINPAALSQSEGLGTAFTQTRLSATDFDFGVSASFPLLKKQLGIGVGWDAQSSRNQVQTGFVRGPDGQYIIDPSTGMPQTQVLGFFTQTTNVAYLSLGLELFSFSVGGSLKYFLSDFGSLEGQGLGADLSCRAKLDDRFSLSAALYDLGDSVLRFNGGAPDQVESMSWAASLSWMFVRNDDISIMAEPGLRGDIRGNGVAAWGGGVEGSWRQSVFVRGGYVQDRLSLGVGLVAHPGKVFQEIRVDYAYLDKSPDGYPSRLTLSVGW